MPYWSKRSLRIWDGVHSALRAVFDEVIKRVDCAPLPKGGVRTMEEQERLYNENKSQTLNSKHLTGEAIDIAPYPIMWPEHEPDPAKRMLILARFYLFAGYVLATGDRLGVPLRWGGDWDGDFDLFDQKFRDLVHFELARATDAQPPGLLAAAPLTPDTG